MIQYYSDAGHLFSRLKFNQLEDREIVWANEDENLVINKGKKHYEIFTEKY